MSERGTWAGPRADLRAVLVDPGNEELFGEKREAKTAAGGVYVFRDTRFDCGCIAFDEDPGSIALVKPCGEVHRTRLRAAGWLPSQDAQL